MEFPRDKKSRLSVAKRPDQILVFFTIIDSDGLVAMFILHLHSEFFLHLPLLVVRDFDFRFVRDLPIRPGMNWVSAWVAIPKVGSRRGATPVAELCQALPHHSRPDRAGAFPAPVPS